MDKEYTVSLSRIEKVVSTWKKELQKDNNEVELPFSLVVTAFFPESYHKIQEAISQNYTFGYIDGLAEKDPLNNATTTDFKECLEIIIKKYTNILDKLENNDEENNTN